MCATSAGITLIIYSSYVRDDLHLNTCSCMIYSAIVCAYVTIDIDNVVNDANRNLTYDYNVCKCSIQALHFPV